MFRATARASGPCEPRSGAARLAAMLVVWVCFALAARGDGRDVISPVGVASGSYSLDASSLAEALRIFSVRHGVLTTYEDPPWQYAEDLEDVSGVLHAGARLLVPARFEPFYAPRRHPFRANYRMPEGGGPPDTIADVIAQIVRAYEDSGGPGRFRVTASGSVVHVIPVTIRARDGRWVHCRSLFDREFPVAGGAVDLYDFSFGTVRSMAHEEGYSYFGYRANALNRGANTAPRGMVPAGVYTLRALITLLVVEHQPSLFWQLITTPGEEPLRPSLTMNVYDSSDARDGRPEPVAKVAESRGAFRPEDCDQAVLRAGAYEIAVTGPRPLLQVAQLFMKRHGVVVTYEDPMNSAPTGASSGTGAWTNRWESDEQEFVTSYRVDSNDLSLALGAVVARYNAADPYAEYEVQETQGQLHLTPIRVRDSSGAWTPAVRVLDSVITVDGGEASFPRFFEGVLSSECERIGCRYWSFSTVPPQIVELPRGKHSVRDMLSALGARTYYKLSWALVVETGQRGAGASLHYDWVPCELE